MIFSGACTGARWLCWTGRKGSTRTRRRRRRCGTGSLRWRRQVARGPACTWRRREITRRAACTWRRGEITRRARLSQRGRRRNVTHFIIIFFKRRNNKKKKMNTLFAFLHFLFSLQSKICSFKCFKKIDFFGFFFQIQSNLYAGLPV